MIYIIIELCAYIAIKKVDCSCALAMTMFKLHAIDRLLNARKSLYSALTFFDLHTIHIARGELNTASKSR